MYHRMIAHVEHRLDGRQYAHRRGRGTEMVLTEIMDVVNHSLNRGRFVYLVSFDVASAFDRVPHHILMEAIRDFGARPYIRRVVHKWWGGRTFQVQMRAYGETFLSGIRGVTCGLLQGGVLPPLLWLLYFDGVARAVAEHSERRMAIGMESDDFAYADDITSLRFAGATGGEAKREDYSVDPGAGDAWHTVECRQDTERSFLAGVSA